MKLEAHRKTSVVGATIEVLFIPLVAVSSVLLLFTLAFLDHIPEDTTWLDWLTSPIALVGGIWLLTIVPPAAIHYSFVRQDARCEQIDQIMLERMETVRLRCADFYDEHGRAPTADDSFELSDLSATPYGDFSLILVADREGVAKIDGKQPVVAPLAPWKSAKGWHSVVLLEDGAIKLLENYPQTRDFYRSLEKRN